MAGCSLEVDLSEQLKRRTVDFAAVTTRQVLPSTSGRGTADIPPTQADSRRWERSGRFSTRVHLSSFRYNDMLQLGLHVFHDQKTVFLYSCSEDCPRQNNEQACQSQAVAIADPSQAAELAEKASAEKAEYDRLKLQIQTWTLATSVIGCLAAWLAYSWVSSSQLACVHGIQGLSDWPVAAGSQFFCQIFGILQETAISYGVGAVGSFIYLRMLNRSIDAVAGDGLTGALGQPRLLIPIALALGFNRYAACP